MTEGSPVPHVLTMDSSFCVHKKVTDHLRASQRRASVSSVYELAQLIVDKCASLFGGHDLDHDLQFFDFFAQFGARVVRGPLE